MKYQIRIFVDGYETTLQHLKQNEVKAITDTIVEYIEKLNFYISINMNRYNEPVALKVPFDFKQHTQKRIHLNPFGFHKPLDVQFDYIDEYDAIHYCDDIWCDGHCGSLYCGCVDTCRGRCGFNY